MKKLSVLLLFGGESSEHEVSIMSARNVYAAMDGDKYTPHLCYIDKNGKWWLLDEWTDDMSHHGGRQLLAAPGMRSFMVVPGNEVVHPDVIFPVLHGKNGEDGTVQGLAELLHIPMVGCGVLASALCMDKLRAKMLVQDIVQTARWIALTDKSSAKVELATLIQAHDLAERIGNGPWFVKPSRAGSSVGVSRVTDELQLEQAVMTAFEHDTTVIVEEVIVGHELEVAVLGNPPHHKASGVGEIVVGDTFYSYDEKYAATSATQTVINADIADDIKVAIAERAKAIYERLDCQGLSRIDFFLTLQNEIYFNEVNTLPGFTNISMYPKLWREAGVTYPQLIDNLIQLVVRSK